jgi:hypothetical protein
MPYKEIKDNRTQLKIQAVIVHKDFGLMLISFSFN